MRHRHFALVIREQLVERRSLGNHRTIGRGIGRIISHSAIGSLEKRRRHALHIGRTDILQAIVLQEHQPPVALRDGIVQRAGGNRLRIAQAPLQIAQQARANTIDLFFRWRFVRHIRDRV